MRVWVRGSFAWSEPEGALGPAFKDVHQLISSGPFLHSYVLALFRSHYAYSTLEDLPSNACESELSRVVA
jgi:hypothetical protein